MFIADTHSDTLFSLAREGKTLSQTMITPERLAQGGVTLQVFALWSGRKGNQGDFEAIAEEEYAQVATLTAAGLHQVDEPAQAREGEMSFMLSLEGCEVFEKGLSAVEQWRRRGIRMGALVWNNVNSLATPAKVDATSGLTAYGVQVVREMQRLGIAVDVSHLNEGGFWDLFAKGDRPPMASHSCVRALCDHARNLTDEQLRAMIQYGGFVGVNFYPYFLDAEGKASVETLAQHIDYICQLGGADIVGLGSDFDGIECTPEGLAHPGELEHLFSALRGYGYQEDALAKIAGGNLLDYYARLA